MSLTVAYGFIYSNELQGRSLSNDQYLEIMYGSMLGRASDAPGKAYWLNLMRNGMSKYNVLVGFVGSNEFDRICRDFGIRKRVVPPLRLGYFCNNPLMV